MAFSYIGRVYFTALKKTDPMNQQLTQYIESAPEPHQSIMRKIRAIMQENVPGLQESFKWSRPVFGTTKDFAYLQANKSHVSLGFYRFDLFDDPDGLLEGTGKTMRHVKLRKPEDIDEARLKSWLTALTAAIDD